MKRLLMSLAVATTLLGCVENQGDAPPPDLGAFKLGHNIVVASKMKKGPVSRDATEEEWVDALRGEIGRRFGGYDGDQLYHFGVSVEGYMLAPPGLPVIYNPRSALIINVTVWDDEAGAKLNAKPHQMTIYEDTTSESATIGSGRTRTREEQIAGLSENAVDAIQDWLEEQVETQGWFASKQPAPSASDGPQETDDGLIKPAG